MIIRETTVYTDAKFRIVEQRRTVTSSGGTDSALKYIIYPPEENTERLDYAAYNTFEQAMEAARKLDV